LVLKKENAKVCVMLAIFTSVRKELNDTKHFTSKTNTDQTTPEKIKELSAE
jgi:hypothetical protein